MAVTLEDKLAGLDHKQHLDLSAAAFAVVVFMTFGLDQPVSQMQKMDALTILNGLEDVVTNAIGIAEIDQALFGHRGFLMLVATFPGSGIDRCLVHGLTKHQVRAALTYLRLYAESKVQMSIAQLEMASQARQGPGLVVPGRH
jgi:hypothetical protein